MAAGSALSQQPLMLLLLLLQLFLLLLASGVHGLGVQKQDDHRGSLLFQHQQLRGASQMTQQRSNDCTLVTGGYCFITDCDSSRGNAASMECASGHCLCKSGYCAISGACVVAPATSASEEEIGTVAPIRLVAFPDICLSIPQALPAPVNQTAADGAAMNLPLPPPVQLEAEGCPSPPQKFEFPIGGIGMIRSEENRSQCLAVLDEGGDGAAVIMKDCSIAGGASLQFELPAGASGMIRWKSDPSLCLALHGARHMSAVESGSRPPAPLMLQKCDSKSLAQKLSLTDEAPPPYQPCESPDSCSELEAKAVLEFCSSHPTWPNCQLFTKCPPGGCNNGDCISGNCVCRGLYTGDSCEKPLAGPAPLSIAATAALAS
mmetsp:Transcript_9274/g.13699  ORF Transcript_9274/g.13699 Transcript_9274/m.13699 type:complete len:375 (+) Transcript_9274:37-1161(+)